MIKITMATFHRVRSFFIAVISLALIGWCSLRLYAYFTHKTPPVFVLDGLQEGQTFGKTVNVEVRANNNYKIGCITAFIDDKKVAEEWVKTKQVKAPLILPTTTLADGEHTIVFTAQDTSYHANSRSQTFHIWIDNTPLNAAFTTSDYTVFQGKTLHLIVATNKRNCTGNLVFNTRTYQLTPTIDGSTSFECFIPIDCEAQIGEQTITAELQDLAGHKAKASCHVSIKAFDFPKQRGFSVSEEKVAQEKEAGMSMNMLNEALEKWLTESSPKKLWNGPFLYPIDVQRTTTPFGEIRTTSVSGRYLHKGLDLANRPRSIVWAAQHGKVIIKDRFFTTGNTVVLDHGLGVQTLYAHLENFADIEVGQTIKKGSPLGKVGMTGYANGYHLHWELRINNTPVDPSEWTTKVF